MPLTLWVDQKWEGSIEIEFMEKEVWTSVKAYGENEDVSKEKKNTFYEQIKQGIGDWEGNQNADIEEY